jgi:hypothetical protein
MAMLSLSECPLSEIKKHGVDVVPNGTNFMEIGQLIKTLKVTNTHTVLGYNKKTIFP